MFFCNAKKGKEKQLKKLHRQNAGTMNILNV